MHVAELNVYPVKSIRPLSLTDAVVEPWGLADDRRWMVVDADGVVVTARKFRHLLMVTANPTGPGRLRLNGPHAAPIDVHGTASAERVPVEVWRNPLTAVRPSDVADAWFSKLLDHDVRLVWLDDPTRRSVNLDYGLPGDRVSFADAFPLLIATTASMRQLNDWITADALEGGEPAREPLPIGRFRPNVVIDTDEPFAEDTWRRLRIGSVDFRAVKLCDRCVLTTIDADTLVKGPEPLLSLARHRRWDGKVWFGLNLVPDGVGRIAVGDEVSAG